MGVNVITTCKCSAVSKISLLPKQIQSLENRLKTVQVEHDKLKLQLKAAKESLTATKEEVG